MPYKITLQLLFLVLGSTLSLLKRPVFLFQLSYGEMKHTSVFTEFRLMCGLSLVSHNHVVPPVGAFRGFIKLSCAILLV